MFFLLGYLMGEDNSCNHRYQRDVGHYYVTWLGYQYDQLKKQEDEAMHLGRSS